MGYVYENLQKCDLKASKTNIIFDWRYNLLKNYVIKSRFTDYYRIQQITSLKIVIDIYLKKNLDL